MVASFDNIISPYLVIPNYSKIIDLNPKIRYYCMRPGRV